MMVGLKTLEKLQLLLYWLCLLVICMVSPISWHILSKSKKDQEPSLLASGISDV